jgi:serine/threonine-protein kinase
VSPQNVLVGADGVPRVLDFGVAKAAGRIHTTREGQLKGKLAYMATEQLRAAPVDRRTDVYAAGVVLWEALTLKRLFPGESEAAVVTSVLERTVLPPSSVVADLPAGLDAVVLRAVERDPSKRFETAQQMAFAVEACIPSFSSMRVADWIAGFAGEVLALRAKSVAQIENDSGDGRRQPVASEPPSGATPARSRALPTIAPATSTSEIPTLSHVSISVSTEALRDRIAPKWRRPGVVFAGFGLGAVAVVAAILGSMSSRAGRTAPSAAASPAVAAPPAAVPMPSVAEPAPAPLRESTRLPSAPSPVLSASATPRAHLRPEAQVAHAKLVQPDATATSEPTCVVRSFVDEVGIKHYAKDCK